ncbi:ANTAR domain-containing response regulator [Streptomyces antimycoticus]|uniref:ANTAR domain-containing response regulator n=1 Tax=Streptomyces antimycoticus TaxID=68175 RepID=UPI00256FE22C|nr:ANTAR domain-containing protein [Streptomyces antimycoticus]WJD96453.1 ANTAR domain-containing protein [Streptomyces antimycoticus]
MPDRTHIRTACQTDAPSLGRGLAELAEQAAAGTPDSCGATATAVLAEESSGAAAADRTTAATHPDLSALVSVQMSAGEGPILAALDTGRPAGADDLLHDDRWPSYRARALDAGVRSTATLPFACDGLTVTVSVYGLRPGPLKKAAQGTTELLGDLATESMARDRLYRAALVQVDQLDTALRTRPVVDQACGIVMYVLGCDAEQAFDLLRRLSQRTNKKLAELAEIVVRTRGRGLEKELIAFDRSAAPGPGRPASGPDRDLPG